MKNESCNIPPALTLFNYGDGKPHSWGVKYDCDVAAIATFDTKEEAEAFLAECNRINSGADSETESFFAECDRIEERRRVLIQFAADHGTD